VQTSVVIVNPAGTGSPIRLISARFAPFPPRSGFIPPFPSALPDPNEYTYFGAFAEADFLDEVPAFARAFRDLDFVAIGVILGLKGAGSRRA
jgi:hypothetical protein